MAGGSVERRSSGVPRTIISSPKSTSTVTFCPAPYVAFAPGEYTPATDACDRMRTLLELPSEPGVPGCGRTGLAAPAAPAAGRMATPPPSNMRDAMPMYSRSAAPSPGWTAYVKLSMLVPLPPAYVALRGGQVERAR